nr:alpha/beta hydrolase [Deinococcus aestuarii]
MRHADARDWANRVHAPTLLLDGADDNVVRSRTLRRMLGLLPNARLIRVPGASHAMIDGQAGNVARLARAFVLAGQGPAPPRGCSRRS